MGNAVTASRWYIGLATAAILSATAQNIAHAYYLNGILERVNLLHLRDPCSEEMKRRLLELQKTIDAMQEAAPKSPRVRPHSRSR